MWKVLVWSASVILPALRFDLIQPLKFALLSLAFCFCFGCGSAVNDEREHIPVYGQVTINAAPVGDGVISFIPAKENTTGSPASTNILSGKYKFTDNEGPSAGQYRVRINPPLPTKDQPPAKESTGKSKPISGGPWEFELTVTEDLTAKGTDFELSKETSKSK